MPKNGLSHPDAGRDDGAAVGEMKEGPEGRAMGLLTPCHRKAAGLGRRSEGIEARR